MMIEKSKIILNPSGETGHRRSKNLASLINLHSPTNGRGQKSQLGNRRSSTSMLGLDELQSVKEFVLTVEQSLEEKKFKNPAIHDNAKYSSQEISEDTFYVGNEEEEKIRKNSVSSFIPNLDYDIRLSQTLSSRNDTMAPLSTETMNELNLESLELEPSTLLKKSSSMFAIRDNSIHPVDSDDQLHASFDMHKEEAKGQSDTSSSHSKTSRFPQSVNEEHHKHKLKRQTSFLKFVDVDPTVCHQHCSSLKPKKSAMKGSCSSLSVMDSTDQSVSSGESTQKLERKASFSTVEFRTYNVAIGDNPGSTGSKGTPVSLCWEYDVGNIQLHDLEIYEELRPKRRSMTQLYLSPYVREWMLLRDNGYTSLELKNAAKEADKARKERNQTATVNTFAPISVQQKIRGFRKRSKRILRSSSL